MPVDEDDFAIVGSDGSAPDTRIDTWQLEAPNALRFDFSSQETDVGYFLCSLDGGPRTPCRSGQRYLAVSVGPHTFSVAAVDAALNTDPTPAEMTVDVTPVAGAVETTFTQVPPTLTFMTEAHFAFASDMPNAMFECALDGGAYVACTSPATFSNLSFGVHELLVRAVAGGHFDATPASHEWRVEPDAPAGTLTINLATRAGSSLPITWGVVLTPPGYEIYDARKLVRKEGSAPTGPSDGDILYYGWAESLSQDLSQLLPTLPTVPRRYEYALFACKSANDCMLWPLRATFEPTLNTLLKAGGYTLVWRHPQATTCADATSLGTAAVVCPSTPDCGWWQDVPDAAEWWLSPPADAAACAAAARDGGGTGLRARLLDASGIAQAGIVAGALLQANTPIDFWFAGEFDRTLRPARLVAETFGLDPAIVVAREDITYFAYDEASRCAAQGALITAPFYDMDLGRYPNRLLVVHGESCPPFDTLSDGEMSLWKGPDTLVVRIPADPTAWESNVPPDPDPDTAILSGPSAVTTQTSATFTFSAALPGIGTTFECSLDDGPFAACSSPHTENGLPATLATHHFAVRAKLGLRVDPTPAVHEWTIDPNVLEGTLTVEAPVGKNLTLAWSDLVVPEPVAATFSERRLLRKESSGPLHPADGALVATTTGSSAVDDLRSLTPTTSTQTHVYHYALFVCEPMPSSVCLSVPLRATFSPTLSQALRGGGYTLIFRHAETDRSGYSMCSDSLSSQCTMTECQANTCASVSDKWWRDVPAVDGWYSTEANASSVATYCPSRLGGGGGVRSRQMEKLGSEQSTLVGEQLLRAGIDIAQWYTSEHDRALRTGRLMAAARGLDPDVVVTRFDLTYWACESIRCAASFALAGQTLALVGDRYQNRVLVGHAGFSCTVIASLARAATAVYKVPIESQSSPVEIILPTLNDWMNKVP